MENKRSIIILVFISFLVLFISVNEINRQAKLIDELRQAKQPVYVLKNLALTQEITVGSVWDWRGDKLIVRDVDTLEQVIRFSFYNNYRNNFSSFVLDYPIDNALYNWRRLK